MIESETLMSVLRILYYTSFVWVPLILITILWDLWLQYRRGLYLAKQSYVLIEIKLPREIFKSPKAMEFCIDSLHNPKGEGNWYEKYWKGQLRPWFSLEIVSIGGAVHFYIWTKKGDKNKIEANLYSQYPGIEIFEVPDYTLPVRYEPGINEIGVSEFKLTKADAFPIKTYVDYGMDKDPKEEFKIDPLTPLVEFMGSLPPGHQGWIQIIIRAHVAEEKDPAKTFTKWKIWETWKPSDIWDYQKKKDLRWEESAKAEIDKIIAKGKPEKDKDGKAIIGTGRFLTEDEQTTIKALGRSISKKGFDVGMRMLYIAPKDTFDSGNKGGLIGGIMHFNSPLNGFAPDGTESGEHKNFLLLWKKRKKSIFEKEKVEFLEAYKKRMYFHKPHKRKQYFILNTEELATLFHLPGAVLATPTFTRIDSRKSEAPPNLPI